jgi:thiamine biosynthesis lipoprotein
MPTVEPGPSRRITRREALTLGVGLFVVATLPRAAGGRRPLVRRTLPVMGTIAEFAVVHGDPQKAQAAIDSAAEELRRVDLLMTRFSSTSEIGEANRFAAARPVALSAATARVLEEALAWAHASEGAFDPSLGRAIVLWDVGRRKEPPPDGAVRRLAGRGLFRAVELDTWRRRPVVRLADPDAQLDLGGIAKGYGVDQAVAALQRHGVSQAIVAAGGDLYALGPGADGAPWTVGIRAPEDPERLAATIEVQDAAVATSGDYMQYFLHRGRRYHHLLDPATAEPRATPVRSVTVTAPTCLAADAAGTAVFGMAPERAARLLQARAPGARIVRTIATDA